MDKYANKLRMTLHSSIMRPQSLGLGAGDILEEERSDVLEDIHSALSSVDPVDISLDG